MRLARKAHYMLMGQIGARNQKENNSIQIKAPRAFLKVGRGALER